MESLLQSTARGGSHSHSVATLKFSGSDPPTGAKPRRCLEGQQAGGWCGAESWGAGQQPRRPGAPTGRVGGERGAWGGMEGWRSRGRSGRELHPPPYPRRGVSDIKSWLPTPASPKRAKKVSKLLPSAAGRGQPVPRATMGGRGPQGEHGRAPARRDLQQKGGTHGRGRATTQQGHGDPRAPRRLRAG